MITAVTTCSICQKPQEIQMTKDQLERVKKWRETGEHVQDILPNHSADDRELLISGVCPSCWSEVFKDEK